MVDLTQRTESTKILAESLPNTPSTVGDNSSEIKSGETTDSLKTFKCSHCPFSCSQIVRLSRHENKHYIKADHQVCIFSNILH